MRRLFFYFLLILIQICLPQYASARELGSSSAKQKIIVGGDHNYPPYEYLDENNDPAGYNVDLTRAVAGVMGIDVEIRLESWDQVRQDLKEGKIDALQGMIESDERKVDFSFYPHSIVHEAVFARRSEGEEVRTLEQLRGKELILQKGGIMHDYVLKEQLNAKLTFVDTHAAALRLLASGQHDYALVANLPSLYLGKELGLSNIVPVGKPFPGLRYGYAVKKGNDSLLALFSEGLAILKNTGQLQEIHERWLGPFDAEQGIDWKNIIKLGILVLGPMLIFIFFVIFWNRSLKREVTRRTQKIALQQQQLIQADKMTSLGILVSGVAHEINNPTGLLLYNLPVLEKIYQAAADTLEERYQQEGDFLIGGLKYSVLRGESAQLFAEMQDGAMKIKRIVEDLKDFARKDSFALAESVDLNEVARAAVRLVENSIKKATSCFSIDCSEALPAFKGNRQRIEQVIINLLLNACQALTSKDQMISLRTYAQGEEIVLEIKDEGCGIPAEQLTHLTDPFYTTRREQGGTGLGLSISASIIEEHQGRFDFSSELELGTCVSIYLPIGRKD
jgi:polar amino acid transport system substrate-binding protein